MNRLQRPPKPEGWDAKVQTAENAIEAKLRKNQPFDDGDFPNLWSKGGATSFETAQHRLCGYCSSKFVNSVGHIDHYRPKTKVHRAIARQGSERAQSNHVEGRSLLPKGGISPAWPRLAYDWNNYVYACERCNVVWKKTLFPALHPKTQSSIMGPPQKDERALLLSPFELTDPETHFVFAKTGDIRGRTPEGDMTVKVCGLDRPTLVQDRHEHFYLRLRLLDDLTRSGLPKPERHSKVREVVAWGQWDREYAAMWRDLVRQRGLDWAALEDEASHHPEAHEPSA